MLEMRLSTGLDSFGVLLLVEVVVADAIDMVNSAQKPFFDDHAVAPLHG